MKQQVIDYISNNYDELHKITKKITNNSQLTDDLLQECLLQILEKDRIILDDPKNIKYFIIGIIRINFLSSTSPFHYKIRREICQYNELTIDIVDENEYDSEKEDKFQAMEESIGNLDWFKKELLSHYMVLGSLKKVNQLTKIPIPSISRYINETKQQLKEEIINKTKE